MSLPVDNNKTEKFGPYLCSVMISLIQEMTEHCNNNQLDLKSVSAFADHSEEWPRALLNIYESMYSLDCQKML